MTPLYQSSYLWVKSSSCVLVEKPKHFIHVGGNNDIGGDLNIDSVHNIHIGGYEDTLTHLITGKLNVGGDINATAWLAIRGNKPAFKTLLDKFVAGEFKNKDVRDGLAKSIRFGQLKCLAKNMTKQINDGVP